MIDKINKRRNIKSKPVKTSRTRKPQDLTVEEWQIALRREYGRAQDFSLKNLSKEPFFSEFSVTNATNRHTYRVVIRGKKPGLNFCSCPDFAVNTLGTCKHIEWTLAKLERKHGAKKAFREGYRPSFSEVYLEYGPQRRVRFGRGTLFPADMNGLVTRYFNLDDMLRPDKTGKFEGFMRELAKFDHEVRVYDDALEFIGRLRDREVLEKKIEKDFAELTPTLNGMLRTKLYPYQQKGALFAARAGRCLIADDMGLGKTVQAIGAAELLAKVACVQRVLVVCPTSLKYQWKYEIERFTRRKAEVILGLYPYRKTLYQTDSFYKIVNYDIVSRDLELIHGWAPDLVILDEAQRIKNWKTRRAQAVKRLRSEYAIVLTGTPLENRLEELHSLMEFVDQYHLGPLFRFLHNHQHTDDSGRVIGYHSLDRIQESLAPVLLRRHKDQVLRELPERADKHFFVDMTQEQWEIHESNREVVAKIVAKWRRFGFLTEADQRKLMVALQLMRMSCNSTYLIDHETDKSCKMDECMSLIEDLFEMPGVKIVIFSQWLRTHEMLIRRLDAHKRDYAYFHGSLEQRKRKAVLDRFKSDADCRVLLCTDSGGVGLNLQEASAVIIMDQPWNPAILEQRIGRVHRLGQQRSVQVYHFIARGTIEQNMLDVIKFKTSVFKGVLDGGETEVFLGKAKMNKFMETVEEVSSSTTEQPPVPVTEEPGLTDEVTEKVPIFVDAEKASAPSTDTGLAEIPAAGIPAAEKPGAVPAPSAQGWETLVQAGMQFIGVLANVFQSAPTGNAPPHDQEPGIPHAIIAKDEHTGAPQLRIPLPDPATAGKLADMLTLFGNAMRALGTRQDEEKKR
ncbi:MAG: RNA polymerase-associated protein RapA [Candidatus Hydrogenedentes bacterium ADurb.Bin101]|nr:MAG: RNA polymerase-associated protein RapA [Candidatus Hydrogenedentes bacterium ADurb.Bin101]